MDGHNVCILGKAGTGKSAVVRKIKSHFTSQGKKCQIVCSSGIACDVYNSGEATTVHSHYGLQKAEIPVNLLLQRVLSRNDVVSRIKETEVVIWDEISMSSQRTLEIVNRIHMEVLGKKEPFGGIQMILVGDFQQLKPVPSNFDCGNLMFRSAIFDVSFPHRIELNVSMRQDAGQEKLKKALDELRNGDCSVESEQFLQSLNRDFPSIDNAVHIYFKRQPVDVHNFNSLMSLPGELLKFEATSSGRCESVENSIPKLIHLKEGCKVMLLYNLNRNLRNGSRGTFLGMATDNEMKVQFPKSGVVKVPRKTWYAMDREGKSIGSRTQFPIVPCYATTAHKAQGLTLDSLVVHCSREFVAGQTYVALSRVRNEETLKVIAFKKKFILPISPEITNFKTTVLGETSINGSCCVHREIIDRDGSSFFKVQEDSRGISVDEEGEGESLPEDHEIQSYFEDECTVLDLEDVFLSLIDFDEELSIPPPSFDAVSFIKGFVNDTFTDDFTKSINEAAAYALNHIEDFKMVLSIFWGRLYELFKDHLVENPEKTYLMSNKDFTLATGKLNSMFLTSEYRQYVITVFQQEKWSNITTGQQALSAQMLMELYTILVGEIAGKIKQKENHSPVVLNVEEMNVDGKAKVRHVGGWAVRKAMEKSRRYVRENKFSCNSDVRVRLMRETRKVELLEEFVITPYEVLGSTSETRETLAVTEARQFRERGLLHISDKSYRFFMTLEQKRINHINEGKLKMLADNMVEEALRTVTKDEELRARFADIFSESLDAEDNKVCIIEVTSFI